MTTPPTGPLPNSSPPPTATPPGGEPPPTASPPGGSPPPTASLPGGSPPPTASPPGGSPHLTVAFQAHDPACLARFWAALLVRRTVEDTGGILVPGTDTQLSLRFVAAHTARSGPNPMHPHLTSTSPTDQARTVARALDLGATHLDVGQRPEEGHIVLADPEGNEFCVIEPDNAFLAGCGPLGELACDGTRAVGLFWSAALGWPLVWDHDQETAIQSPHGGTKVAWGGSAIAPERGRGRQRFDMTAPAGSRQSEVDRLTALGASWIGDGEHGAVVLTDPDGNEFTVNR